MNVIVEGIYRRGTNISIKLMKGQISNCTAVQGLRGLSIIPFYWEWIFQQRKIWVYLRSTKGVTLYPWPNKLRHSSKGWYRGYWNGYRLNYLYLFSPLFSAITFTLVGNVLWRHVFQRVENEDTRHVLKTCRQCLQDMYSNWRKTSMIWAAYMSL